MIKETKKVDFSFNVDLTQEVLETKIIELVKEMFPEIKEPSNNKILKLKILNSYKTKLNDNDVKIKQKILTKIIIFRFSNF
jgi:hypothetical protein